jgi:hypothetical protein
MAETTGVAIIPDPEVGSLGPAMRALNEGQRRFAMAAVIYPLAKDWQIAKAAGYSDRSHGALRVTAHRLFHDDKILAAIRELADKEIRGSALLGIATMKKIARYDGHKDQLKAAAGLVGLAGFTVEQKISVNQTVTDMSGSAMLQKIAALCVQLGVDPAKLIGINAAPVVDGEFTEV